MSIHSLASYHPQITLPNLAGTGRGPLSNYAQPAFDLAQTRAIKDQVHPFQAPFEDHFGLFDKTSHQRTVAPPSSAEFRSRLYEDHVARTVDQILNVVAQQESVNPYDMLNSPKGNIGTHAFVAVLASLGIFLNWYLILEKVNNPDASTLLILFSTIPVEAVLLNLLGKFTYELWQMPVLEKIVRPKIAALFNLLKLTAVTPAFRSANGLPSYFKEKMNLVLRAIMFEHEVIDLKDDFRKLEELAARRGLDQIAQNKMESLRAKIKENAEYLQMLKEKLDTDGEEKETEMFARILNSGSKPVNAHLYTMVASTAATVSMMLYAFGLPDPAAMDNTKNLLIFFLIKAFLVYPIRPLIEQIMVVPVYEYLARPRMVASMDKVKISGIFPSMEGVLGLPPRDRWLYSFDAFIKSIESVQEKYDMELYLLGQQESLSPREEKRKQELTDLLVLINEAMDEMNEAMDDIKAQ